MFYTCTTPNCAIALSKATFPVAMNCPVCLVPLELQMQEAILTPEDQSLLESLPYVIAYPLKRTLEEKHAWTKINLLKDTFLNYLKYLGLLTASEFFNSVLKNRRMVDAFQKNLAQPSFGSWNVFIRECITFLKEQNHTFFYPELLAYYESIETGPKRKLYKGEIEYIDSNGDAKLKKQETTAIGILINFRNRYLGHGLTLDEQASQQLWDEYFPVFKTLLEQLSFAKEYPMLKREHGETHILLGTELKEINSAHILDGSIWIENKQGEAFEILPFYIVPGALALAKEDKEQVLSYESFTGKTIKFFSPEGSEKQTSGVILDKLNLLLRNKQKETSFTPETFTKEVFLTRIVEENKLVIDTLIQEKKVIEGIYQHRETIEIKLREWIGARANIFFIAAEAGSGKTNLLVEIQKQYRARQLPSLFIRAARMEKSSLKEQIAYQLNLDTSIELKKYKSIADTQAEPTFIFIDGLNEASNAEAIWDEILEISTFFESGSLKFVLTNRANSKGDLERYLLTDEQYQFIYSESKQRDNEKGLASHVFWLTPMDMKEMEGAWEAYVKIDKTRFKPIFSFNDLATFDRGLYLQISNPLVLRIFLETYQGKNLPKETKHLHIWKDWFDTFSEQEQLFMRLLADAIWEKGENEIELEEVLNNESLREFILTDNISGPYHRLLNLGWISRYQKDLTLYVSFTVEGLLIYLLGVELDEQKTQLTAESIEQILTDGTKLKKVALESFLFEQARSGKIDLIAKLIDEGNDKLKLCVTPLLYFLKSQGVEKTFEKLLENPTENKWKALLEIYNSIDDLQLYVLRFDFLRKLMNYNQFLTKAEVWLSLEVIRIFDNEESLKFLSRIDPTLTFIQEDEDLLFQLGRLEFEFSNYDKALEYNDKSLDVKLKTLGKNHPSTISSYNNIGTVWYSKGNYDKALVYFERCLSFELKTLGEYHFSVAKSLNNIGLVWQSKGNYDKALEYNEKSLAIRLKTLGENHTSVATNYNNIGSVWQSKGNYDKALKYYEKSLFISLKTIGENHPDVASIYNNIGLVWDQKCNYDKALEYNEKGLEIFLKTLGENHVSVAICYNNIGSVWESKGNYDKTLEYYEKSLAIRLKTLGENHDDVATIYNNIGLVWDQKCNYDKALEFYEKGLEIFLKTLGENHASVATCYNNIGSVWESKGNYDKALEYYEKSLAIRLKILGVNHPDVASIYNSTGAVWYSKGNYDKALEYFEKSLSIRIKTIGENHPYVATSYENIAEIWRTKGNYDNALEFYDKSLAIRLKKNTENQLSVAKSFINIGIIWKSKCNFEKAIENFKKGYEILKKGGFPYKIAECYESLNDKENALDYYIQSAKLRKEDPEVGLEAETTQHAIANALRLAKELGKEEELPEWMG